MLCLFCGALQERAKEQAELQLERLQGSDVRCLGANKHPAAPSDPAYSTGVTVAGRLAGASASAGAGSTLPGLLPLDLLCLSPDLPVSKVHRQFSAIDVVHASSD